MRTIESLQRKLRALTALAEDAAATEQERETARLLKARLAEQLDRAAAPPADWTSAAFRLGRAVQAIDKATAPPAALTPASRVAFRLGRALGQGLRKGRSP